MHLKFYMMMVINKYKNLYGTFSLLKTHKYGVGLNVWGYGWQLSVIWCLQYWKYWTKTIHYFPQLFIYNFDWYFYSNGV